MQMHRFHGPPLSCLEIATDRITGQRPEPLIHPVGFKPVGYTVGRTLAPLIPIR
jgi:hypothetical protein